MGCTRVLLKSATRATSRSLPSRRLASHMVITHTPPRAGKVGENCVALSYLALSLKHHANHEFHDEQQNLEKFEQA